MLQFIAAFYSLWLIRITGLKYSWVLISTALFFMGLRRLIPLYYILTKNPQTPDLINEIIGLFLSFIMLLGVYGIKSVFIEFKHSIERKKLLAEREIFIKEVHHRIKNYMNTIYGLLSLQAGSLTNSLAVSALEDACSRVQSMMVLYDKLYQYANFDEMSCSEYLSSLVDEILNNFPNSKSIRIEKKIDDFILNGKVLQPLGIIVNELLTNIMKYAFINKADGVIKVSATLIDNNVSFFIEDNGDGIPESITFENTTGFGMQLVSMLSEQIGGSIKIERSVGTKFILEFQI